MVVFILKSPLFGHNSETQTQFQQHFFFSARTHTHKKHWIPNVIPWFSHEVKLLGKYIRTKQRFVIRKRKKFTLSHILSIVFIYFLIEKRPLISMAEIKDKNFVLIQKINSHVKNAHKFLSDIVFYSFYLSFFRIIFGFIFVRT